MAQQVFKILNATDVKLISIGDGVSVIKSMTIANVHTGAATIDLYLKNAAGTIYYIIYKLVLPNGQTLKLDSDEVSFDNRLYDLYINLAGTTPVDVIIN
tara:strand:- start:729 stop:1025 length:297 start_codon:yes stop_codon:yes gene_type:complete